MPFVDIPSLGPPALVPLPLGRMGELHPLFSHPLPGRSVAVEVPILGVRPDCPAADGVESLVEDAVIGDDGKDDVALRPCIQLTVHSGQRMQKRAYLGK